MLNIISKVIAASSLALSSFLVCKSILQPSGKVIRIKNISLLTSLVIVTIIIYNVNYSPFASLIIFLSMIVIYKLIFTVNISKSVIVVGLMFILYFIADIIVWVLLSICFDSNLIRANTWMFIASNLLVSCFSTILSFVPSIQAKLNGFIKKIDKHKYYDKIFFFILIFIVLTLILYNISVASVLSKEYLIDVIIMIFFFILAFIYINEKLKRDKLDDEYDKLMEYVSTFENWIDDEQLNNHEYKNQLAVIRNMAKNNKKVVEYIDELLKEDMYVEDFWINEIKYLPSGGIKGLLYYKLLLTKKENIDICLSVSRDVTDYVKEVDNEELKNISRVLGIYLDNAIDAAKESDNKVIAVEIYPRKSELMIVISNTYDGDIDLNKIAKKGYTTKGKGHGRGLYFAEKIINRSSIMKSKRSLINSYYVQKLIIHK